MDELEAGHPRDWSAVHIRLSLVSPKLEAGIKIRKAVSHSSNPGCLRLIVIAIIV